MFVVSWEFSTQPIIVDRSASAQTESFVPSPGAKVSGRYVLVEELARGGMGTVWLAEDAKLRRSVAVKILTADFAANDSSRRRFEREAMAVAQLQCPNVVQVFDYGVEGELPFIVMERMRGEDLRVRLKRERRLPIDVAANIVWQVAKALAAAHAAGIIHRDLKPGNVFLVSQGDEEIAKVLDFGVAKTQEVVEEAPMPRALVGKPLAQIEADEKTKAGTILGTPHFMAPEQARGRVPIDHRADLWSLGIIAYRMITGKLPYRGTNAAEVIVKVVTTSPPPPSTLVPGLPPEVDAFFEQALAHDRDERFESAKEMARALRSISNAPLPTISVPDPRALLGSEPWLGDSGRFTPVSQRLDVDSGEWSSLDNAPPPSSMTRPKVGSSHPPAATPSAPASSPQTAQPGRSVRLKTSIRRASGISASAAA